MAVTGLTPNFCTQKATQGALIGTNLSLPLLGFLLYPIFGGGLVPSLFGGVIQHIIFLLLPLKGQLDLS